MIVVKKMNVTPVLICLAAALLGIAGGKLAIGRFGPYLDGANQLASDFWLGFIQGFFITVVPLAVMILLSVTVYGTPVALCALAFETAQDAYYILSALLLISAGGGAVLLPCVFFITARAFLAYCYLLLRCAPSYRAETKTLANGLSTLLSKNSRLFYRDFTAVAGLMCIGGFSPTRSFIFHNRNGT